jgi:hypothetical protein
VSFGDLARRVDAIKEAIASHPSLGALSHRLASKNGEEIVTEALSEFSGYHTHPAAERHGDTVELVDRELVLYYRNRLAHHAPALAAAKPVNA